MKTYESGLEVVNMSNVPVVYQLCRMARIMESVNNAVTWRTDNSKVSPGFLIESLVISTLSNRKPLWKMHEFWSQEDLDFFYPELSLSTEWLNDDAYARALDKLSDVEMMALVSKISLEMLKTHGLDVKSVHLDTTSKSVQGAYPDKAEGDFDITYGYSKDKRPDLLQFKIGAAVQQDALIVMGEMMAGNHTDNSWNPDAIKGMRSLFEGCGYMGVTFIGDAATVASYDNLDELGGIRFISRLPETFGIAAALKEKALQEGDFEDIGILSTKETSARYKLKGYTEELNGAFYRFVVVHSTALEARKESTLNRNIEKAKVSLTKKADKLQKQPFACEADAQVALDAFRKTVEHEGLLCRTEVQVLRRANYGKRGRPKGSDPAEIQESFHACCEVLEADQERLKKTLENESTFVLISSVIDGSFTDRELLTEYKHQNSIEEAFRFLKSPVYLGQVLLNRKERVEAMGYVFILVLMIASYLQYRVRKSLKDNDEYVLDPGNKKNKRPSVKRVFEILEDVLVIITPQGRFFPAKIQPRILDMIRWAGFDPDIYLKI